MRATRFVHASCLVLLIAALHAQAQQTVYKWVDKDGKTQFSDNPPPPEVKDSTSKRMGGGYTDEGQVPYATQMAAKRYPVVLYATAKCGELCTQGRELLGKRGIPFSEKSADDKAVAEEVKGLVGAVEVPVLKVGSNTVKGYSDVRWQMALDEAGYARTLLPGQPGYKSP
ncbi:MAG: glutaredoxin family protein [Usitatibacter sp.]